MRIAVGSLRSLRSVTDISVTHFIIVKGFSACNRSTLAMFGLRIHASAWGKIQWRSRLNSGIVAARKSSSATGIGAENDLSIALIQPE